MLKPFWDLIDWIGRFLLLFQITRYLYSIVKDGLRYSDIDIVVLGNLLFYWAWLLRQVDIRLPRLYYAKGTTITGYIDKKGNYSTRIEYRPK